MIKRPTASQKPAQIEAAAAKPSPTAAALCGRNVYTGVALNFSSRAFCNSRAGDLTGLSPPDANPNARPFPLVSSRGGWLISALALFADISASLGEWPNNRTGTIKAQCMLAQLYVGRRNRRFGTSLADL